MLLVRVCRTTIASLSGASGLLRVGVFCCASGGSFNVHSRYGIRSGLAQHASSLAHCFNGLFLAFLCFVLLFIFFWVLGGLGEIMIGRRREAGVLICLCERIFFFLCVGWGVFTWNFGDNLIYSKDLGV